MNIISGKADVTFAEPAVIIPFLKKTREPQSALLPVGRPMRVFATSFVFKMGEIEFKSMLDSAVAETVPGFCICSLRAPDDSPTFKVAY